MSTLTISRFELTSLFLTRRGWFSIAAFLLVWLAVITYVLAPAARFIQTPETGSLLSLLAEFIGFDNFSNWSSIELSLYWTIALYLLPFFTLIIAADQMASDRGRGTLRFLTLRASRSQLFFGRFIGQCLIQLLLILITLLGVFVLIAKNSPDQLPQALSDSPIIIINLLLVLMPYVALMSAASVVAKSARQATLVAMVAWIVLSQLLNIVQLQLGPIEWLNWLMPGSQVNGLLELAGWQTLNLAPVPLLHCAVLLFVGWFFMQRSEL